MAFLFGPKKKLEEEDLGEEDFGLPPLPPEENEYEEMPAEQMTKPAPVRPSIQPTQITPSMASRSKAPTRAAKIFVRIDKYKDIVATIEAMNEKINNLQNTLNNISAIKTKEAEIISGWGALLADAKAKADEVSEKLLKPAE